MNDVSLAHTEPIHIQNKSFCTCFVLFSHFDTFCWKSEFISTRGFIKKCLSFKIVKFKVFECECVCVKRRKMKDRPEIATFFLNTNIQYDLHAIKTLWIYIVVIVNINFTIYFYVFQAFLLLLLFLLKYLAPSTHWYAVHLHSLVLKTLNYEKSCDIWKPNGKFYFFLWFLKLLTI